MTGRARSKAAGSPPHITVSAPFSAPAWPLPAAASSRATSAEAVVLSIRMVPSPMPAKAPSSPSTTPRRSSSLPTQENTISAPSAAWRGVGAAAPPCFAAQASAFAAVRL